jgi:hypothetical protein
MPGSDTTTLIITGDSSGAVAALRSLGVAYQEAGTQTEKGKKSQQGFNEVAIPGKRDIRELSFAAFELSGSMGTLGPVAQQARAGINLLSSATQGTTGPIGIAIAAIGLMVYALTELFTATKKAEEASLKASEGLSKEGDNLKKYADLLKAEIEYRHQLLSVRREDAEKQLEEVQNRTLLQNLMKGGLNVYGYEINALGKVVNAHWAESWAAAKYHEEIDKGLTKIAKYNVELETTTDKIMKVAAARIKGAMGETEKEMEKPAGAYVETPEDKWGKRRLQQLQENAKAGEAIERQAREDSLKFNEEYDQMLLDREAAKFEAMQMLRSNDVEAERVALERKSQALAKYTGDALGAAIWLARQKKVLDDQEKARELAMNMAKWKSSVGLLDAMVGAINMNAKQQIEAQMAIAAIHAAMEIGFGLAVMAIPGKQAEAMGHFAAAIQFAGIAAASYRQMSSGGGGGGGGAPGGEGGGGYEGGGGTASPTTPSGPVTNYIWSSFVVNGNIIGLDNFRDYLDEWWNTRIRSSGGDIKRGTSV